MNMLLPHGAPGNHAKGGGESSQGRVQYGADGESSQYWINTVKAVQVLGILVTMSLLHFFWLGIPALPVLSCRSTITRITDPILVMY